METELKLAIDPDDIPRLMRCAALASARPRRVRVVSEYFDTPEATLAAHEMALRVRRVGRRWWQTLKAGASGVGGLHERGEWEHACGEGRPDLALFAQTPLAELPDARKLHERLAPVFRVDVIRTTWRLRIGSSRLEVACDQGTVAAGGRSEPIAEVEIECIKGPAEAAFALASRLLDEVALRPSSTGKAERGYRLFGDRRLEPVKAVRVRLEAAMAPLDAGRALVAASLAQLQANEEGLLTSDDPEFVHQARVAMRRMRSALRIFRRPIGRRRAKAWRDALADAGRALGAARDWDVFATETLPLAMTVRFRRTAAARRLERRIEARRRDAREAARAAIRSVRYARTVLELAQWLREPRAPRQDADEALERFAGRVIGKRHARLVHSAHRLAELSPEKRHRVRIDAKRLRYVAEGLASVFDEMRVRPYVKTLVAVQDELGQANDAATALAFLARLAAPRDFAARARRLFEARVAGDHERLAALARRLARYDRFWSHHAAAGR